MDQLAERLLENAAIRFLLVGLCTLLALWGAALLKRGLSRLVDWVGGRLTARAERLNGVGSLSEPAVTTLVETLEGLVQIGVFAAWFLAWLVAVAYLIDTSHRYVSLILEPVLRSATKLSDALIGFLPDLVVLALILALGRVLQAFVRAFTKGISLGRVQSWGLDPALSTPTHRILTVLLWTAMVIVAMPYLPGAESKAFQAVSVVLGVLVSFGSSGFVSNWIAGLSLTYARAYRVGDRVRIGDYLGDVVALGSMTTRLRSIKDEELIVPNSYAMNAVVTNYSRYATERGIQAHAELTIGYDTPYEKVERLLVEAAMATPGIAAEPPPYVLLRALEDYYVRYEVCAYSRLPNELHLIEADLRRKIQDFFFSAGVEICSPAFMALRDGNRPMIPDAALRRAEANTPPEQRAELQNQLQRRFQHEVLLRPGERSAPREKPPGGDSDGSAR